MSGSTTHWVSRKRTGLRPDRRRAPRNPCRPRNRNAPGPPRDSARRRLRPEPVPVRHPVTADATTRATRASGSSFIAADPGVSTARGDFGFRSLSDVDSPLDPQTGKIVSRWLGRFQLESGAVLPDLVVAYRHDGVPVGEGRQILVVHALTGSADAAGDWWAPLIGPGQVLDTDKFGVICMNLLGSRYGTSGPTSRNPVTRQALRPDISPVTVRDQARAQWRLLDALGIGKLALAVGGSLGRHGRPGGRPGAAGRDQPRRADRRTGAHRPARRRLGSPPARDRGQARHGGPGPGPPAGDHHLSQRDRLRAALRRPSRAGWHAFDRQLPAPPGPKASGAIRSGHVPLARPGDGHARHRPRPRRSGGRSGSDWPPMGRA